MADSASFARAAEGSTQYTLEAVEKLGQAALAAAPAGLSGELRERLRSAVETIGRKSIEYVVAGLFNAGKSTLLNSLLQQEILPHSDRPETGAPAWIRRGPETKAVVRTRAGAQEDIPATPHEIAKRTSLYDEAGCSRTGQDLAERVEITSPRLPLDDRMAIIDLPGLRDSEAMNDLALSLAFKADVVLWVFRSDQTFSKQDAEAVAAITSTCGAHVVQLVVNVISDKPTAGAWRAFKKEKLPVHRLRIREGAAETGLDDRHAASLFAIHARALRQGFWGVTYGGREFRKFFRKAARKNDGLMKAARIVRLVRAAAVAQAWCEVQLGAAEEVFERERLRHEAYKSRIERRARLNQEAGRIVDRTFTGLSTALAAAAGAEAAQISTKGYKAGVSHSASVVDATCSAIHAQIANLGLNLSSLAVDPEARSPGEDDHLRIRQLFAGGPSGTTPEAALRAMVSSEIGVLETRKLGLSIGRVWDMVRRRGDTEAAAAVLELQDKIRTRMSKVTAQLDKRKSDVRRLCQRVIEAEAIPVVPQPDAGPRDGLCAFASKLAPVIAIGEGAAREPS